MDQLSAHLDRGWDLLSRGDVDGARLSAEQGLEIDAESPELYNLLGFVHAAAGEPERALELFEQAIALEDTFLEAMLNAAEIQIYALGDTEGALRMIEEALDLCETPDEVADTLLLRAEAFAEAGDEAGASRVVADLPDGPFEAPHICLAVGRARLDAGDLARAEKLLREAAERDPEAADAHYLLALLLEERGEHREATARMLATRDADLRSPPAPWSPPHATFERQVQNALGKLAEPLQRALEGALVVVDEVPGAEVVADGVDPRVPLLADAAPDAEQLRVDRLFVYQRNIERVTTDGFDLEEVLLEVIGHELEAVRREHAGLPPLDEAEPTDPNR